MSEYDRLSGEERVRLAIDCVARSTPIPAAVREFLHAEGLLEAIEAPGATHEPPDKG